MVCHGWHDDLHDAENDGIAGLSHGSSSKRGSFPCFAEGQSVVVNGREYLFEPARRECEKALGVPRDEMGGLGVKRCVINFFDYHQSIGCYDFRGSYLARLDMVSEESTQDGFQRIRWRNMYSPNAHRARQAAQEYLNCFLHPEVRRGYWKSSTGASETSRYLPALNAEVRQFLLGSNFSILCFMHPS